MQFSLSLLALALTGTLSLASPVRNINARDESVVVTFTGADPSAFYTADVVVGGSLVLINDDLSISTISWDDPNVSCSFTGTFTGAATGVAVSTGPDSAQFGPPQPVTAVNCYYN